MLDIHAPGHPVFGVRDFFLHLLTITAGLLIALGLEAGVEAVHHRHLRHEAEANILQELRDNRQDIQKCIDAAAAEEASLKSAEMFAQARMQNKPYDIHSIQLGFNLATVRDDSWRTATTTGVVNYMDYSEVKKFSSTYRLQDQFVALQASTLDSYIQLQSYILIGFDPEKFPPELARVAARDIQQTLAHLEATRQIGVAYLHKIDEVLKES